MSKPKEIYFGFDELLLQSLDVISQTNTEIAGLVFPSNRTDPRIDQIRNTVIRARVFHDASAAEEKDLSVCEEKSREGIEAATGHGKLHISRIENDGEEISFFDLAEPGLKLGDLFVDPSRFIVAGPFESAAALLAFPPLVD